MDDAILEIIAKRMSAMGDVTRLKILQLLMESEEMSVSKLCETIGARPSNISQHLAVLFNAGLVIKRKEGNQVFYAIDNQVVKTICNAVCDSLREEFQGKSELINQLPHHAGR
jgi:DNA-binding transcriptional ArsR family regulator